ncbi:hypothetical protein [Streptomyces sp. NPDC058295]|uniref:hypothetical protein n=1 Tax=Streptomyces sp. NPDC058295 TaxID=3346431 RepID=UPI0036EBA936
MSLQELSYQLTALRPRMEQVSLAVHGRPELKFAEYHAQQVLTGWLIESGFTVSAGAGGLDTAFTAVHEGSKPVRTSPSSRSTTRCRASGTAAATTSSRRVRRRPRSAWYGCCPRTPARSP